MASDLSVVRASRHPDLALDLVRLLPSEATRRVWLDELGEIPSRSALLIDEAIAASHPQVAHFRDILPAVDRSAPPEPDTPVGQAPPTSAVPPAWGPLLLGLVAPLGVVGALSWVLRVGEARQRAWWAGLRPRLMWGGGTAVLCIAWLQSGRPPRG